MAENEEELKSLLKVKDESEKADLKLTIQRSKIMASSSITSWQIEGEVVEAVTDFIFLVSKITRTCDCSHEIERCLLFALTDIVNLDNIKNRDIILPAKILLIKSVFSIVMYGCKSWIIKEAEF